MSDGAETTKSLAAIIYERGEDINRIMAEFATDLAGSGLRVGGFVQVAEAGRDGRPEAHVRDLETGVRLPIFQNWAVRAIVPRRCRGSRRGRPALERSTGPPAEFLVVNRFGRLESEGEGIVDEIAAAATSGIPVLIGVSTRYLEAWRQFAMGFCEELACSREALDAWWRKQVAACACAADP